MSDNTDFETFRECLRAAALGPFFPDWEFPILFGLDRSEVQSLAQAFAPTTPLTGDVALALHAAMNNLLGYPHQQEAAWADWLSVTPAELQVVFHRWKARSTGA